jgi:hypothetical protein
MQWIANALETPLFIMGENIMEENFSQQNDSFENQTQREPYLSQKETEILPTAVQSSLAEPQNGLVSPRHHSLRLSKAMIIGVLVLLIVFLASTGAYAMERPHISGGSASILITPDSQHLNKTYSTTVTLGSTDPTLNPIGVHVVSMTTPAKSLTVTATGTQQQPATYAHGVLRMLIYSGPLQPGEYTIQSNSGVSVAFSISSTLPSNEVTNVPAQAIDPGPGGNIRGADFSSYYKFPSGAVALIVNYQPFTGGRKGYDVSVVSQTDIDNATSQMTNQLKSALSADQAELKSRLAFSEQLLDPTNIHCQPSVKANRNPNDQASDVTVTGTMTCSATAYTPAKLQAYGANLLGKDAYAQWSGSYVLIGQVQEKLYSVLNVGKIVSFALDVQGLYVFQLSPGMSAHFASLIAGQAQANAQGLLLQQVGVDKVSILVSGGLGTSLPSSAKDIHITILSR